MADVADLKRLTALLKSFAQFHKHFELKTMYLNKIMKIYRNRPQTNCVSSNRGTILSEYGPHYTYMMNCLLWDAFYFQIFARKMGVVVNIVCFQTYYVKSHIVFRNIGVIVRLRFVRNKRVLLQIDVVFCIHLFWRTLIIPLIIWQWWSRYLNNRVLSREAY